MDSKINVLITGAGAPGIMGTFYSIKNNYDNRESKLIGVDITVNVVGKYFLDGFYVIPSPKNEMAILNSLRKIVIKENIHVILPQVTSELYIFAKNKKMFEDLGCKITISDYDCMVFVNDKFNLSTLAKSLDIPVPEFYKVSKFKDLEFFAKKLGFPENKFVVKPPISNGMRGFREVVANLDLKNKFYSEKPDNSVVTLEQLYAILGDDFPELLLMEYLPNVEWSVDAMGYYDNKEYKTIIIPRTRDVIRSGITFTGTIVKNEHIINSVEKICNKLKLNYMFGFQFKEDVDGLPKLIESNPRIQGTMVMSSLAGANIIYSSIKYALGESVPEFNVNWNMRFLRYWSGVSVFNDKFNKNIGDF